MSEYNYKACDEINEVLAKDQCVNGFRNTQEAIILWLCRCDTEARKQLLQAIINLDNELDNLGR